MKPTVILFTLLTLMFAGGCQKEEHKDTQTQERLEPLQTQEQPSKQEKENQEVLNNLGISTEGEKIVIDPKKTKAFLEGVATTLQSEAVRIKEEAKKIKSEDLGIHKESDKVIIDINKTKKVLKGFTDQLEDVAKSLENVFDEGTK
ncbi:MAG TPA: hypothetical protein ENK74_06855 [Nitratifractor sp.]|nr:hypothetical protein [Nitratifractor sp.]